MNLIPLKTVLHEVSTNIDSEYIDEDDILSWAYLALNKLHSKARFHNKTKIILLQQHKARLPRDAKKLIQIAYAVAAPGNDLASLEAKLKDCVTHACDEVILTEEELAKVNQKFSLCWQPLRLATSTFHNSVLNPVSILDKNRYNEMYDLYPRSEHEYSIEAECIVSTLNKGFLYISYLTDIIEEDGEILIPDNPELVEALFHYVMYRYWLKKSSSLKEGAFQQRDWHLKMFETLKTKVNAAEITIDVLENIRQQSNTLFRTSTDYYSFFANTNRHANHK